MTIIFVEPLGMHNVTIPWAGFTQMGTGTWSGILVKCMGKGRGAQK